MNEEITFAGQRTDEKVLMIWRQHPWILAKPGLIVVAILLIVGVCLRIFGATSITSFVIVMALIVVAIIVFLSLFMWLNGTHILTTERVIDVDQRKVFHRVVGELPIEHIQDVAYEVKGPIATILNFGNVVVQTIGGGTTITIEMVQAPYDVQQEILEARNKYVRANPDLPTKQFTNQ